MISNIRYRITIHAENMKTKHNTYYIKCHNIKPRIMKGKLMVTAMTAMAMQAQKTYWEQQTTFDLDSYKIRVDNRCSVYISGST